MLDQCIEWDDQIRDEIRDDMNELSFLKFD